MEEALFQVVLVVLHCFVGARETTAVDAERSVEGALRIADSEVDALHHVLYHRGIFYCGWRLIPLDCLSIKTSTEGIEN